MNTLLAILQNQEIATLGSFFASGVGLWALRKLGSIDCRLAIMETAILNCRNCKAHLPPTPEI